MSAYPNATLAENVLFIQDLLENPEPRTALQIAQSLHWCNGDADGQRAATIKAKRSLDTLIELKWAVCKEGLYAPSIEPFNLLKRFIDLQRTQLANLQREVRQHYEAIVNLDPKEQQ